MEQTGWAQRLPPTCFPPGATTLGGAGVIRGSRARLESIVDEQLSPVGRLQVNTALSIMDTLAEHLDRLGRGTGRAAGWSPRPGMSTAPARSWPLSTVSGR